MHGRPDEFVLAESATEVPARWAAMLSETHLPWSTRVSGVRATFRAQIRRQRIDDLALVDCECSPCSGVRSKRQIAATDDEFVVVLMNRAGRESVTQNGVTAELGPGDAIVWDSTSPARFTVRESLAKTSLIVPRSAIDEIGGQRWIRAGARLHARSASMLLLTNYLDSLSAAAPGLSPQERTAARNAALELLVGALRTEAPRIGHTTPGLRESMDRFIERNLTSRALTPSAVADAHTVSVRTANRVFHATGETVTETIRRRRLARARAELAESDQVVAVIAARWGFADASHFGRVFKARYGLSPADFRARKRQLAEGAVARTGDDLAQKCDTPRHFPCDHRHTAGRGPRNG